MEAITIDELEIEYGTAILSELCGTVLTRNQQPVRLFDQTRHSAEYYFKADQQGKPYIQDFQNGKRYYAVTAYSQLFKVDFNTAKSDLSQRYYGPTPINDVRGKPQKKALETSPTPVDFIPIEHYQLCQTQFERNGLYEYLRFTYGTDKANEVFAQYRLGTSKRWRYLGFWATCLPQFDITGKLRQVKVMPFDAMNGRRVKKHQSAELWNYKIEQYEPTKPETDKTYFAGRQLAKSAGLKDAYLKQCFFGEHLLSENPDKAVALVEGESTAIVCSIIWPQYVWLATGGSSGAGWTNPDVFSVLQGRNVTLWPDTGKYKEWSQKAESLRPLVQSLYVTDYVEKNTPAGMTNVDLRDLLTQPCYFPYSESQPVYGQPVTDKAPVKLPKSLEYKWSVWSRPPLTWNKIGTHKALQRCLEQANA